MALDIEGVEDGGVHRQESLCRPGALETLQLELASACWLMRILRSIVLPLAPPMAVLDPKVAGRSAVGSQVVCHQPIGDHRVFLEKLAHQFQRRAPVATGLNENVENLALGVDGAPEVSQLAVDLQVDFIQMPNRVRLWPTLSQIRRDDRTEMVHPSANGFVRHRNPSLGQQVLDVTQAEGEPKIEPNRLANDLGREAIAGVSEFGHPYILIGFGKRRKLACRDKARTCARARSKSC